MTPRRITIILMVVSLVALLGWDIWVIATQEINEGGTISEIVRDWAVDWWIIAYACGVLIGHWFLTNDKITNAGMKWTAPRLGWATVPVLGLDLLCFIAEEERSMYWLPIPVLYGVLIGYLFWATMPRKSKGA